MKRPRPYDDDLDARLAELFQEAEAPVPPADFVARTMQAVRQTPLPAGRQRLRRGWMSATVWTAIVGAAAAVAYAVVINEPFAAEMLASMLRITLHWGTQLVHFVGVGLALSELFSTIGHATARAAATREGTTTLMLIAAVAGTSVLALQRLLFSDREDTQWQELS